MSRQQKTCLLFWSCCSSFPILHLLTRKLILKYRTPHSLMCYSNSYTYSAYILLLTGCDCLVRVHSPHYRSVRALAAAGAYLGMSSVILRIKSDFSAHPLQDSPHSSKIFFRSLTLSFFRSTEVRSSCLSTWAHKRESVQVWCSWEWKERSTRNLRKYLGGVG